MKRLLIGYSIDIILNFCRQLIFKSCWHAWAEENGKLKNS
jgi:hypothetical protein